jgi:C-terminal processing protease CtpA/Prc
VIPSRAGVGLPARALCWAVALGLGSVACGPSRGTIGAVLAQNADRRLFIREVPPGLAADRAGVREGDEVLLIDGRDARQMTPEAVHGALSGDVGEGVKLTLVRDDEVVRVRLERSEPGRLRSQAPAEPKP